MEIDRKNILLVEDDQNFALTLKEYLISKGFKVKWIALGEDILSELRKDFFDAIIIDQNLPDGEGISFSERVFKEFPDVAILIITAYPDIKKAISALKLGVINYLIKPFEPEELLYELKKAIDLRDYHKEKDIKELSISKERLSIIGVSDEAKRIREFIKLASQNPEAPVLLTGETGTGKSLVAKLIHYNSPLRNYPFLVVNCAAIPESLLESELFGYERGAFTGAHRTKKGMFELANGGTLFLDEIGDMDLSMQAKLLHVLESGRIRRIGGEREINVRVRVIAATNKNLEELLDSGEFRKDLYFRLAVLKFELPPLRRRPEDIIPLAEYFLKELSKGKMEKLSDEDRTLLLRYDFPGNVRELRNIIERALILSSWKGEFSLKGVIDVREAERRNALKKAIEHNKIAPLEEVIKQHVEKALTISGGNRTRAAQLLGISISTLKRWMKKWSL